MAINIAYYSTGTSYGSATNTEKSLPSSTTSTGRSAIASTGIFQLYLDLTNMATSDEFRLRWYETVNSLATSSYGAFLDQTFVGPQSPPLFVSPAFTLCDGWDVTLSLTTGSARTFAWGIKKIA
jgi:hypothetical protein